APQRDENQLHAAVVELVALDDAEIKYSTVQNWYPGNSEGLGGIYNFVTKRGDCRGNHSKISWTQVETGSAITWKYPSGILIGDKCGAHTVPYVEAKNSSATFEHEATTSKISEDVLFYCIQRGLSQEEAVGLVVNGFVKDVLQQLPMEFAVEAQKLISISLEGSVG